MRQTWEEHGENHEAFLAYLTNERAGISLTPHADVAKWRRRFGWAVALIVLLLAAVIRCAA
jgi:hypothetical protein